MAIVYAISYKGFPVSKIGVTSMDVRTRAKQLGFVLSDDLQIATLEVPNGFAVERMAHNIAEQRGGQCVTAVANNLFQDPDTGFGIRMNNGNTEVFCVTFKQACRIIKEASKMVEDARKDATVFVDLAKFPLRSRSQATWADVPVKAL